LPDYIDTPASDELFVTELGFSAPVSELEYDEAYQLITDAVADIVSERPEALELLADGLSRGRSTSDVPTVSRALRARAI